MNNLVKIILISVIIFMLLGCSCSCKNLKKEGFSEYDSEKHSIANDHKIMIIKYDDIKKLVKQYVKNHPELKKVINDIHVHQENKEILKKEHDELSKRLNVMMRDDLEKKIRNYDVKTKELRYIVNSKTDELKKDGLKIINQSVEEFMRKKGIDLIFEPIFYNWYNKDKNYYLTEELFNTLKEKLNIKEASEDNPENN